MKPPRINMAEADQAIAQCRDIVAGMWAALFHGLVDKGLTRAEALVIVAAYVQKADHTPPQQPHQPDNPY